MDLIKDFETVNADLDLLGKYPLYSQDGKRANAVVVLKYFIGGVTWYVIECGKENDDVIFFAWTHAPHADEFGYVSLKQLAAVHVPQSVADLHGVQIGALQLTVERDLYLTPGQTLETVTRADGVLLPSWLYDKQK